ncbi:GHMP kinase, partial [Syncephalis plumigaleata]
MDINHHLLAALGVSHSALEDVRRITCDFGLVTKLTGAGGGGCALTLIPDDISAVTLAKVKSSLEQHGYQCYETNVGGGGVAFAHFTEADQMLPNHPAGFLTVPADVLDNGVNWLYYSPSTATSSTSTI